MGAIAIATNSDQVARTLESRASVLMSALTTSVSLVMLKLQAHIVSEHLSGRPGLNQITGTLATSIRAIPAKVENGEVSGGVEGAGGPAFYGRFHEFGTSRPYSIVPKNARALKFHVGGRTVFAKSVNHPPIQERSFMRSSLAEMRDQIVAEIQQSVTEALGAK